MAGCFYWSLAFGMRKGVSMEPDMTDLCWALGGGRLRHIKIWGSVRRTRARSWRQSLPLAGRRRSFWKG